MGIPPESTESGSKSAESVVQTANEGAATTTPGRSGDSPPSRWIVSPSADLVLFIATPVLILPLLLWSSARLAWEEIAFLVAAFGAMGHHLPGMLRAYGDRALFRRFRVRFVVAPVLIGLVLALSGATGMKGAFLIAYVWAVWHAMMQSYGFLRIYDAKVGSFAPLTAKLDLAMCIAWFGAGTLHSNARLGNILDLFYESGGPAISPVAIGTVREVWMAGTIVLSVLYVANVVRGWRTPHRQSPVKLFAMATSLAFWWYTAATIAHTLIGVAVWEIFHDVQYLSIVWIFNRARAQKSDAGAFTRFLFRRSPALVGVYVGLVFAYGYLGFASRRVSATELASVLEGLLIASGVLHFYFDGFIWKMREPVTRQNLIAGEGGGAGPVAVATAPWVRHALRWSLLVLPLIGLIALQERADSTRRDQLAALVASVPGYATGHYELGIEAIGAGDLAAAENSMIEALRLQPDHREALVAQLLLRAHSSPPQARRALYSQAIELAPRSADAHLFLGMTLESEGDLEGAARQLVESLDLRSDDPAAHARLGRLRFRQGQLAAAERSLTRALELAPGDAAICSDLASTLARAERFDEAISIFERATRLRADFLDAEIGLAHALALAGRTEQARAAAIRAAATARAADKPDVALEIEAQFELTVEGGR